MAYYWAVSSLERANLTLRYHEAWFEGSWWRAWTTTFGPSSDYISGSFWFLSKQQNGMRRQIWSRTVSIPATWDGNVSVLFNAESKDYNVLPYYARETIALTRDITSDPEKFYTVPTYPTDFQSFDGLRIDLFFRLNPTIYSWFDAWLWWAWSLDDQQDIDWDRLANDELINWSWQWNYNANWFRIIPTKKVTYFGTSAVVSTDDMAIRESLVNELYPASATDTANVSFTDSFQPLAVAGASDAWQHTIISEQAATIQTDTFEDIFANGSYTDMTLTFSLINFLQSKVWFIYPFLEYKAEFNDFEVPDRFFTITSVWTVWDFTVTIVTKKPTFEWWVAGDFTVIF